jgi:hypothetical protein
MTSRSKPLTFKGEKKLFDEALKNAVTAGTFVHGTTLDWDIREAINAVAHEYPNAKAGTIRKAKAEWQQYADWRASV